MSNSLMSPQAMSELIGSVLIFTLVMVIMKMMSGAMGKKEPKGDIEYTGHQFGSYLEEGGRYAGKGIKKAKGFIKKYV